MLKSQVFALEYSDGRPTVMFTAHGSSLTAADELGLRIAVALLEGEGVRGRLHSRFWELQGNVTVELVPVDLLENPALGNLETQVTATSQR
jgi:hypothetical protein